MDEKYKKLLGITYKYLGIRPRSEKEIRDYLIKKNADEDVLKRIINSLKQQKFLNDEEFARMWVESRVNRKALRVIKLELKQKGVSSEIIENFESEFKYQDGESILQLAEKRAARLKNEPVQKRKEKLFRFLSSKGYDYDTIKDAVDKIFPR